VTREEAARGTDGIRPGYYVTRLVRGGPMVPFRIVEDAGKWVLLIRGEITEQGAIDNPFQFRGLRWPASEISGAEYEAMLKAAAEAKPGEPLADPTQPISWRNSPPLY
jgi:hypothetical protein